jgi:HEAT repeat protein
MKAVLPWALALPLACAALGAPARAAAPPSGHAEIAVLIRRLDDDRFATRHRADEALRGYGADALPLLRRHLARTTSAEVRHRLRHIIHDLSADERIAELVRLLGDPDSERRAQADWHLRLYGKAAVPLLKKELTPTLDAERRQHVERLISELSARR